MPRLLHYSDLENVYDEPMRVARLAGLVRDLDGPDALVVGTGDTTSPGVLALVERGRQALEFFEAVGADLDTFGNHDFDYGPDRTRDLVADSPQTWVSANVRGADGERFGADVGVVPWTVEVVDGRRIGFVGVTDPATDSINPAATDLRFTDPVEAVADAAADLRVAGAETVVVLSHLGVGDDELAALDVDVVLGGHVHSERVERVDGTVLTRPGANGHVVLEIDLGGEGTPTVTRHETADAEPYAPLSDALRGRVEAAGLDRTIATVDRPMDRSEATVFGGECRVGNFVADAYRWAGEADVGLQNSGGIRSGPPLSGEVTLADLVSLVPFGEPVVVAEVTGAELVEAFRQASASVVGFGEPDWWHGHVSGAELVWDPTADELVEARVGGDPIAPNALYTVATADYVLHTDHEFPALDERHRVGECGIQHEILTEYTREFGVDGTVEGRIRREGNPAPSE